MSKIRSTESMSFADVKQLLTPESVLLLLYWAAFQQQQHQNLEAGDSGLVKFPSALIFSFQLIPLTSLPLIKWWIQPKRPLLVWSLSSWLAQDLLAGKASLHFVFYKQNWCYVNWLLSMPLSGVFKTKYTRETYPLRLHILSTERGKQW